ncbi:MAG: response regulator transcription factor [Gemmatimonadetes bacterium]|nr:response regulator transcription factor [Gemmatimonadota bacterium]
MSEGAHVLLVEDEPKTADTVALYLRHGGFRVTVSRHGAEARDLLVASRYDLVVLDRMLPGVDGLALARQVREAADVPIIMLTAMVDEEDRLTGFAAGVDDYVPKPFSPRELVARCQAVLRRAEVQREREAGGVRLGTLYIPADGAEVFVAGARVALSPTEVRLLQVLARAGGRVVSRDDLAERALRGGTEAGARTVDAHVKNLRRKLEAAGVSCIETVFGSGYRVDVAAVRRG